MVGSVVAQLSRSIEANANHYNTFYTYPAHIAEANPSKLRCHIEFED